MISEWTNHLWQSTLFAAAAGLLTLAFHKNRAQVRFWLWISASFKFLLPFSLLMSLGSRVEWAPAAQKLTSPAVSATMAQISQPFSAGVTVAESTAGARDWALLAMLCLWMCGLSGVALMRLRGWLRIRDAVRASTPIEIVAEVEVRSSPGVLEPGVVGLLRPILILPADIMEHLTPHQLEAVLAHELCHVRRRDNLTSAIHMIVEALFWFHPMVWWIGAKLVEERERACDEEVLRGGSEPQVYAEGILNVCKIYLESPLRCVAGVTGSDLKKRIHAILTGQVVRELNFAKKLALAVAGTVAVAVPVLVGIMNAAPGTPKFTSVTITPCADDFGRKRGNADFSPGHMNTGCMALVDAADSLGLVQHAYVRFANGRVNPFGIVPIIGGPAWIHSDLYSIEATADGNPSQEMMHGPMLQVLLEDRFKLKIHREAREVPVYELTVAEGGAKLQPAEPGSCVAVPMMTFPLPAPPSGQKYCRNMAGGPTPGVNVESGNLDEICKLLTLVLDRPVVDKTGISGSFVFRLEFGIDQSTPRYLPGADLARFADRSRAGLPSIFTAMPQQFGLRLEATKGSREFLVIDNVERAAGN